MVHVLHTYDFSKEEARTAMEKISLPSDNCSKSGGYFLDIDDACDVISERYGQDQVSCFTGEREIAFQDGSPWIYVYSFEVYFGETKSDKKDICAVSQDSGELFIYTDGVWVAQ